MLQPRFHSSTTGALGTVVLRVGEAMSCFEAGFDGPNSFKGEIVDLMPAGHGKAVGELAPAQSGFRPGVFVFCVFNPAH